MTVVWKLFEEYVSLFERLRLRDALKTAMEISDLTNKFVQVTRIWDKDIDRQFLLNKLFIVANIIRFVALL